MNSRNAREDVDAGAIKALHAEICTKTLKSVERETTFLIRYRYIASRPGALLSSLTMGE